jgi:hypothetical protein
MSHLDLSTGTSGWDSPVAHSDRTRDAVSGTTLAEFLSYERHVPCGFAALAKSGP